jgi:hypothetical protein
LTVALLALALAGCGDAPTVAPSPAPATASPSVAVTATAVVPSAGGPSPQAGLLLSEVRFTPVAGDAAFVEIVNIGSAPIDIAGVRLRVGTRDFPISATSLGVAPGSQIVVSFDTPGSTDHPGISAPADVALAAGPGSVDLVDPEGRLLDRVAWGSGQDSAVAPPSGDPDFVTIEPGTGIGRRPGENDASQPADWVVYPPGLVSPGRANPPAPTPGPSAT